MFKGFGRCSKDSERCSKDSERCSKDSESVQRIRNLFKGFGICSKGSEDAQRIRKKDSEDVQRIRNMFKGFHTACKVRLRFLSYNYHMLITSKMNPHRSSSCIQAVEKFVVAKTGLNPGLQSSWLPQILKCGRQLACRLCEF